MRNRIVPVAFSLLPLIQYSVSAQEQDSLHALHHLDSHAQDSAPITITINPEARVSVVRGDTALTAARCGTTMNVPVVIVNKGYVTAKLVATLVEPIPPGVTAEFSPEPLSGAGKETRTLQLTLRRPGLLDVTISFRPVNDIPDLGGRDRVHLLLHCVP